MPRSGRDYLKAIKNRTCNVFIGGERVADVTTHPAFANACVTVSELYDIAADAANAAALTYEEGGKRYKNMWLKPRTGADPRRATVCMRRGPPILGGFSAVRPITSRAGSPAWPAIRRHSTFTMTAMPRTSPFLPVRARERSVSRVCHRSAGRRRADAVVAQKQVSAPAAKCAPLPVSGRRRE